jgi:hypothetical protein
MGASGRAPSQRWMRASISRRRALPASAISPGLGTRTATPLRRARRSCSRTDGARASVLCHWAGSQTGCSPTSKARSPARETNRSSVPKNTARRFAAAAASMKRRASWGKRRGAAMGAPAVTQALPCISASMPTAAADGPVSSRPGEATCPGAPRLRAGHPRGATPVSPPGRRRKTGTPDASPVSGVAVGVGRRGRRCDRPDGGCTRTPTGRQGRASRTPSG